MGLDESFRNYSVIERSITAKKIIGRNVDIVVIGEHCEHGKSRSPEPEIGRRRDQSRVNLTGMKTRGPGRRIYSHRQPLDVLGIDPVLAEQAQRKMIGGMASYRSANAHRRHRNA